MILIFMDLVPLDKVTDFHHAFGDSTDFWRDLAETVTFQNESIGVR